jgi:hypothetical protein
MSTLSASSTVLNDSGTGSASKLRLTEYVGGGREGLSCALAHPAHQHKSRSPPAKQNNNNKNKALGCLIIAVPYT